MLLFLINAVLITALILSGLGVLTWLFPRSKPDSEKRP